MSPQPSPSDPVLLGRWFTGARREGFLARLEPEPWHTLCAILSFTSQNGDRTFTLDQLAITLGVSRAAAETRLAQLADTTWKGLPLLALQPDSTGSTLSVQLAPVELFSRVRGEPAASEMTAGDSPDDTDLSQQLVAVGLNGAQIASLRRRYSLVEIRRQLAWLPARNPRNPAALLIRAIEQDWDEPKEEA